MYVTRTFELRFKHWVIQVSEMGTNSKRSAKELNNSVSSTPVKPSTKQMRIQNDGESDIMKILSEINTKLNKLDNIEKHLERVDDEIKELKESFTFVKDTTDEIKVEQKKQDTSIKSIEERITRIEARNADLQRELVDMKSRSMRSNLVFYNLPEKEKDDPFAVLRELLEKTMAIDKSNQIEIERAHRLGGKRDDGKPRPIVAKFLRYQDKECIRKSAYLLKGTKIGIADQFPKEIAETRRRLYPVMKRAKNEGHTVKLIKDKLFINGQRYRGSSTNGD